MSFLLQSSLCTKYRQPLFPGGGPRSLLAPWTSLLHLHPIIDTAGSPQAFHTSGLTKRSKLRDEESQYAWHPCLRDAARPRSRPLLERLFPEASCRKLRSDQETAAQSAYRSDLAVGSHPSC